MSGSIRCHTNGLGQAVFECEIVRPLSVNAKMWGEAAQQIFFAMSLGGGGLTTLASYNDFNNNILRLRAVAISP